MFAVYGVILDTGS